MNGASLAGVTTMIDGGTTEQLRADLNGAAPEGAVLLPPGAPGGRRGWVMADGIMRSVQALDRLSRGEGGAALVGRTARGGTAAMLVFGAARGNERTATVRARAVP